MKNAYIRMVFLAGLALSMAGCVNVQETIYGNGGMTKQVRIEVEPSKQDAALAGVRQNLDEPRRAWRMKTSTVGRNVVVVATQNLPNANVNPRNHLSVQKVGWFRRVYEYQEQIPLTRFAGEPTPRETAAATPIHISLTMPGKIEQAAGATISGNLAKWELNVGQGDVVLQATSSQVRYGMGIWTLVAALLLMATILAFVKETFSR